MPELGLTKLEASRLMPDRVAAELREAIIRGQLKPNDHLGEANIAAQLGVSTVPVREAFHQLEREGLIYTVPHHGRYVRGFSEREISDMNRLRVTLDELAYAMIAEQGGLSPEVEQQLQQDIEDARVAIEARDMYQIAEFDLRFHDHLHAATGSRVLQEMWRALRTRLHVWFHWRLTNTPNGAMGNTVINHTTALNLLRGKS